MMQIEAYESTCSIEHVTLTYTSAIAKRRMCPSWLAGPRTVGRTRGAERDALLSSVYKRAPAVLEEPKPRWSFQIKPSLV